MAEIIEWDAQAGFVTLTNGDREPVERGDCLLAEESDGVLRFLEVLPSTPHTEDALGALGREEWGDVAKQVAPEITDAEFAEMWSRFEAEKRRRKLN